MAAINKALEAIAARNPEEKLVYQTYADQHNVNRTTLMRRHKQIQVAWGVKDVNQQQLNPQQESELVKYIGELTARWIPPTREMIRNFASPMAQNPVSDS